MTTNYRPDKNKRTTNKKPYYKKERKIPKVRPCNIEYTPYEYHCLSLHGAYLDSLDDKQFGRIFARDKNSNLSKRGNWINIMPGLWAKGLIGPMSLDEAKERQDAEDRMYNHRDGFGFVSDKAKAEIIYKDSIRANTASPGQHSPTAS